MTRTQAIETVQRAIAPLTKEPAPPPPPPLPNKSEEWDAGRFTQECTKDGGSVSTRMGEFRCTIPGGEIYALRGGKAVQLPVPVAASVVHAKPQPAGVAVPTTMAFQPEPQFTKKPEPVVEKKSGIPTTPLLIGGAALMAILLLR